MAHFPPCSLPPGSPVWAYLRDSGGETQDLASQRKYLMDYCKYHGLLLLRLFEDAARPGSSAENREQFQAMMDLARQSKTPQVDAIIYWSISRFARNDIEYQYHSADLKMRGYKLVSISDNIPDGPIASMYEAFLRLSAQMELERISKDSKRGLKLIVELKDEQGNYLGVFPGKPPTCFIGIKQDVGITRNNGTPRVVQRIIPDPATWEAGQLAWQMRSERASYREIQEACKLFNSPTIGSCYSSFFRNRIYLGELEYGGRVYPNFVPALTDLDTWAKVQAQQHARQATQKSFKAGKGSYLLSGLCRCHYCKSKMHGSQNTRSDRSRFWRYYLCNQKKVDRAGCKSKQVGADKLENKVVEILCEMLLVPGYVNNLVDEVNNLLSDTDSIQGKIDQKQQEIGKLKQAINRLLDALENGASVTGRLTQRENELRQAERELIQLQAQFKQGSLKVDKSVVEAILTEMKDNLNGDDFKEQRKTLQKLTHVVWVENNKFHLYCSLPIDLFLTRDYFMPPTGSELNPCQIFISTY
jgi:DNA invertase Pin-like site-specific DNA recombinase